ncbi:hypothetical protein [Microbacterium sp.]|uniref:hypothetical protein n=1 Tax=Microbacterium sp. TaxID=51671 RepID=UPI003A904AC0
MRFPSSLSRRRWHAVAALAGGAALALTLAACSGTAGAADNSPSSAPSAAAGAPTGAPRQPGVSGLIAAMQTDAMQVQGDGEQTTVRYTSSTTVEKTETVAASTIKVGDCVVAISGSTGAAATTVSVSQPDSSGACTGGFAGGFAGRGGGFGGNGTPPNGTLPDGTLPNGTRPSGAPADGNLPSGAPRPSRSPGGADGRGGFGGFVVGKVTAVTATQLTVSTEARGTASAGPRTVAIDSSTKVTTTVAGTTSDLAVGKCVTATGTSDTSGGFDAKALTVSPASSDGTCTTGFGGGRQGSAGANGSTGGGQNG